MTWKDFTAQATQWWTGWHIWVVVIIILVLGWSIAGSLVKKKKMNMAQAFFLPLLLGLIYLLGDISNVSLVEWILSALILAFGLWRLYVAMTPKAWNAAAEAVSGKETDQAGIHWSGLVGCSIFHASLVWMIWSSGLWSVILGILGAVFGYLLSCLYSPNLRQRWVVFIFRKPRYALPDLEELEDEDEDEARYERLIRTEMRLQDSRWWNLLLRGKRWMDEGLNLILIPSWFPSFDIGVLRCEKLEINGPKETGLETPWLPTRPELIESDDDSDAKTVDTRKGTKTAGPPVRLTFKLTGVRHDPRPFLRLSDEDREDDKKFQGLAGRYCQAALAWYTRQLTADEAIIGESYEAEISRVNDKRREAIRRQVRKELAAAAEAESNDTDKAAKRANLERDTGQMTEDLYEPIVLERDGRSHSSLFQYIAQELRRHTGLRLNTFEILDIDPSPEVEAAQKAKKTAQIAVETEKLKRKARAIAGSAEGDFIARQIDVIAAMAKISPERALERLTALRLAESGSNTIIPTSILDALGRLFGGRE